MMKRAAILALCLAPVGCDARGSAPAPAGSVASAAPAASAASAAAVPRGILVDAPVQGDVASIVRDATAVAASQKRKLLVYVGATWCKPCQRFHAALASGRLDGALSDVTFLVFDLDRDQDRLRADGYMSHLLPLVSVPAPDGAPSGKQVEGGIPDDSAVDGFVSRIRRMLAES